MELLGQNGRPVGIGKITGTSEPGYGRKVLASFESSTSMAPLTSSPLCVLIVPACSGVGGGDVAQTE